MASDVLRVRLHLREIRVLAVALDTPSELRVCGAGSCATTARRAILRTIPSIDGSPRA